MKSTASIFCEYFSVLAKRLYTWFRVYINNSVCL
nr:MAG TPA: hypothetical protein [Caudoviricetes sp.]